MNPEDTDYSFIDMFLQSGVYRDEEYGLFLEKAHAFVREGHMGLTTHLYGLVAQRTDQVCSPIRHYEELEDRYVFVTRSYNKYIVLKTELLAPTEGTKEYLMFKLWNWFGSDTISKVLEAKDFSSMTLWSKAPTENEIKRKNVRYQLDKFKGE